MIDQWIKKDLERIYKNHSIAVFIDPTGDSEFILKYLEGNYSVHKAETEIEELHIKYQIEKEPENTHLIYTRIPLDKLTFIREYCETNGKLEIQYLHSYVKEHVFMELNQNLSLTAEELLVASKISVGKSKDYWLDICHHGTSEIFDIKNSLLEFLDHPSQFIQEMEPKLYEMFFKKVYELFGETYLAKPEKTIAKEIATCMFDGLANNNCNPVLAEVYAKWLDSLSFRKSFDAYLHDYSLPEGIDVMNVHIAHPFIEVDEKLLEYFGKNISNKSIKEGLLSYSNQRHKTKQAQALGVTYWADVRTIIEFNVQPLNQLNSLDACVKFYKDTFYKLDTAIRNLYASFLSNKDLLEPFQEYYKQLLSVFLDKWFQYFDNYKSNQTGILQKLINDNNEKIAIIVGDGISFEIAQAISAIVGTSLALNKEHILCDLPSETENNMSQIYLDSGEVKKVQAEREAYLAKQNPDKSIEFIYLEDLTNEPNPSEILICTYKDIDEMGEKMQQKALKYFNEVISFMAEKIQQILKNGYSKVYLISDHGFVLTGLLTEADKISLAINGDSYKAERYVRTSELQPQLNNQYIQLKKPYNEYNYLYFSKNINPFKTTGRYGFSHGGASPQELITPLFCWERTKTVETSLGVLISNKNELNNVTCNLYQLQISSSGSNDSIFALSRRFIILIFSNSNQINKSEIITINNNEKILKEYSFDGLSHVTVQLLDAETKELLDKAVVSKNSERDMGGLL